MIVAEWSFNIPKGKSEELRRFLREEIKPLWRAHGAVHEAYRCIGKRYFDYQTSDDETRIVEQIRFKTIEDFERFFRDYRKDAKDYQILKDYESRVGATNPMFRVYREL